jgi:SAM-dependent methyltransferase
MEAVASGLQALPRIFTDFVLPRLPALQAGFEAGAHVLDVGCGAGWALVQLAERFPKVTCVGVDNEPYSVELANRLIAEHGLRGRCEARLMDAQRLAEDDSYDVATSFLVIHEIDPAVKATAFAAVARALRRGGRLGFVCWQARDRNPWASVPLRAALTVSPSLAEPPFLDNAQPGPFYLADPEKLRKLLIESGFTRIEIEPLEQALNFGAAETLSDAVAYGLRIGPASRVVAEADPKLMPAFAAALEAALQPYVGPSGVWLDAAAWVVLAERA